MDSNVLFGACMAGSFVAGFAVCILVMLRKTPAIPPPVMHMRDDRPGYYSPRRCDQCHETAAWLDDRLRYTCEKHIHADAKAVERGTLEDLPGYAGHSPEGVTCVVHGFACPKPWARGTVVEVGLPGVSYKHLLAEAKVKAEAEKQARKRKKAEPDAAEPDVAESEDES